MSTILKPELDLFRDNRTTKDSVAIHSRTVPINSTLSVSGTAESLWTSDTTVATINIVTNPSFETGSPPTGVTASGSTLARSNTIALYDTFSLRITPDNAIAGEGAYWNLGTIYGASEREHQLPISISCYFNKNAVAGVEDGRVRLWGSSSGFVANGNTLTLSASWQRSSLTYTIQTNETWRAYMVNVTQAATLWYCDGLQVEFLPSVTTFCSGAQGRLYSWDGTAHASTSRRKFGLRKVRSLMLHTDRDVYVDYDQVATTSSYFKSAGTSWWTDFPIEIATNISFLNRWAGETPNIWGELHGVDY